MHTNRIHLFSVLPVLGLLASSLPANAQDLATAEALFNRGIADLETGNFDSACPNLAESNRLDPRPGTLFALADCRDKQGQIATALVLYEDYLRAVEPMTTQAKLRHDHRAKIAAARKAALVPEIPQLTLTLPAGTPSGVKVTRDGVLFSEAMFGVSLPVDPGEHVIQMQAGNGPAQEQRVMLQRGEKKTVVLEFASRPEAPRRPQPTASAPSRPTEQRSVPSPGLEMNPRGIAVLATGSVGLAGLLLGAATGSDVLDKKAIIEARCPDRRCDANGTKALHDVQAPGIASTIGFGVGVAGLAAAAVLWLTAPRGATTRKKNAVRDGDRFTGTVEIGPQGAALGVRGRF